MRFQDPIRGRVAKCRHTAGKWTTVVELIHNAPIHRAMENQRVRDFHHIRVRRLIFLLQVGRNKRNATIIGRLYHRIGVHIDGRIQDCSAILVAVGRHVSAATGQTEAQWGARADYRILIDISCQHQPELEPAPRVWMLSEERSDRLIFCPSTLAAFAGHPKCPQARLRANDAVSV